MQRSLDIACLFVLFCQDDPQTLGRLKKKQRTQWNTINAFTALAECLGSSDLGTLGSLFHELNTYC